MICRQIYSELPGQGLIYELNSLASQAFCMILPKALIGFREIFLLFLVADLSFFPGPLSRNANEMAGYLR